MTSTYDFRVAEPDEYRAANTVFLGALHYPPATDEHWELTLPSYQPGRTIGAWDGDTMVGGTTTWASRLAIPGGAVLPMAMVGRVGVRADHTRRGVLTGLMRAQLAGLAEPFATLRASEAMIYRRFGYGVATRGRTVKIDRGRAAIHPDAPTGGRIRIVTLDEAGSQFPEIYRRVGPTRSGWLSRDDYWWGALRAHNATSRQAIVYAIHSGPDGDDGFTCYRSTRDEQARKRTLHVEDLVAGTPDAWTGLWRFLLSVDLVHEIVADLRPLDEPLEELFVDRRAVHTTDIDDETWLRIVDVPQALAARTFGAVSSQPDSIVIEVKDPLLPANSGRYRIGDGPARPVGEPAELTMDVATLATLYLGDVPPSALAAAGHLTTIKDDAVAAADRLFAVPTTPWCGTYF